MAGISKSGDSIYERTLKDNSFAFVSKKFYSISGGILCAGFIGFGVLLSTIIFARIVGPGIFASCSFYTRF